MFAGNEDVAIGRVTFPQAFARTPNLRAFSSAMAWGVVFAMLAAAAIWWFPSAIRLHLSQQELPL